MLRKELLLMKRNPIIPKIIFIMPIGVMLLLPLVATMDVRNVNVTVVDNDRSQLSRRLVADMDATSELKVTHSVGTHAEAVRNVEDGKADVILTIPPHWSRDLSQLYVEANGVNATKGTLGAQYVSASLMTTLHQWQADNGPVASIPSVSVKNSYNPTLNFRNFMIPALLIILLIIICGFLPALNLVSEKETGTIEAMNVTPVGRFTFVLSKLIPFWITAIFVITVGMLIGWLVYDLWPAGSVWDIYVAAILFSLVMSGHNIVIANHDAAGHIRDVRLHHDFPADGRPVHSNQLHAAMGADRHIRRAAAILQRDNPRNIPERRIDVRPVAAVCMPGRNRRIDQRIRCMVVQEEGVSSTVCIYFPDAPLHTNFAWRSIFCNNCITISVNKY